MVHVLKTFSPRASRSSSLKVVVVSLVVVVVVVVLVLVLLVVVVTFCKKIVDLPNNHYRGRNKVEVQ